MTIVVKVAELPIWTRSFVDGFKTANISVTNKAEIPSNWHDANCRRIYLRNSDGRIVELSDNGYESAIYSEIRPFFGMGNGPLKDNCQILIAETNPRRVTLYTNKWESSTLPVPLTEREIRILATVRGCIAKYRREVFSNNKVTEAELSRLRDLGMLDKRNALTLLGKNHAGTARPFND